MRAVLFIAFIVVPLVELFVIIQVAQVIDPWPTVLLLIAVSAAGAWLVKREGLKSWRRLQAAVAAGRLPAVEVVDGALVLFGGALLLTPGFLSDALGLLLVFPLSRGAINRIVRTRVRWRIGLPGFAPRRAPAAPHAPAASHDAPVDVEVVEVRRSEPEP